MPPSPDSGNEPNSQITSQAGSFILFYPTGYTPVDSSRPEYSHFHTMSDTEQRPSQSQVEVQLHMTIPEPSQPSPRRHIQSSEYPHSTQSSSLLMPAFSSSSLNVDQPRHDSSSSSPMPLSEGTSSEHSQLSPSPTLMEGRLSPTDIDEEIRRRSRRNEARSRGRVKGAEEAMRNAIFVRNKQVPSTKNNLYQLAADIMVEDKAELDSLRGRLELMEQSRAALELECETLQASQRELEVQNASLKESIWTMDVRHKEEIQRLQHEMQLLQNLLYQSTADESSGGTQVWN